LVSEAVATGFEFGSQLDVVINLAVGDEGDGPVFVVKRLPTAIEVDDAEAAHREMNLWRNVFASSVRATVEEGGIHSLDGDVCLIA